MAAAVGVVDVAFAGWGRGAGLRLRLPVEEIGGDGVVAVASGRGVVLFALLQGDEEVVGVRLGVPERTFSVGERLRQCGAADGGQYLVAGVARVQSERDVGEDGVGHSLVEREGLVLGLFFEDVEQLQQFVA